MIHASITPSSAGAATLTGLVWLLLLYFLLKIAFRRPLDGWSLDDQVMKYRGPNGESGTVPRSSIKTVVLEGHGWSQSVLKIIGEGNLLAAITLPNSWATKAHRWLLDNIPLHSETHHTGEQANARKSESTYRTGGSLSSCAFKLDDDMLISTAIGRFAVIPRSSIEGLRVEAKSPGKSVLKLIGHGVDLASFDLPHDQAEKTRDWLIEQLGL